MQNIIWFTNKLLWGNFKKRIIIQKRKKYLWACFCASAHKLPCIALVTLTQCSGLNVAFLGACKEVRFFCNPPRPLGPGGGGGGAEDELECRVVPDRHGGGGGEGKCVLLVWFFGSGGGGGGEGNDGEEGIYMLLIWFFGGGGGGGRGKGKSVFLICFFRGGGGGEGRGWGGKEGWCSKQATLVMVSLCEHSFIFSDKHASSIDESWGQSTLELYINDGKDGFFGLVVYDNNSQLQSGEASFSVSWGGGTLYVEVFAEQMENLISGCRTASRKITLLKNSRALENASIGSPSFSSQAGSSFFVKELAPTFMSDKRIYYKNKKTKILFEVYWKILCIMHLWLFTYQS